jgi:UDP-N-acetylglucosamine--N-acetylmuramyl-(pentapeptide) pyrophosphoryl-undecaprenol N-acetylglucosamine transferase
MKKLLIMAGGTGGHIFPALVVAQAFQKQGVQIEWLGTEAGMEKNLVSPYFPLHFLPVKALRGKSLKEKLLAPFRLVKSVMLAYQLMKNINPDVVMGMGGYASGPGGIAAWLLRKPLVIHEQNAKAGLTNRVLARFATRVLQAFPDAFSKNISAVTVGNPVRESIAAVSVQTKSFDSKPWKIVILGGSQGAMAINRLISDFLSVTPHRRDFLIWHQTGQRDFDAIQKKYAAYPEVVFRVAPFIEKMEEAYAWADIVVCRAGALTVSEVAAAGVPAIFIPFPGAVDDHQYANAQFLVRSGAAVVFRESDITPQKLGETLISLLSSPIQLQTMANQAKLCAISDSLAKVVRSVELRVESRS